MVTRLIQRHL